MLVYEIIILRSQAYQDIVHLDESVRFRLENISSSRQVGN